ncbi:MAG: hypothetical protein NVS9B11_21390 [Candidatus Dormibacteraceae bacterium]
MFAELMPAFSLGLLATLSPCALPLYPGFLAYLAAGAGAGERAKPSRAAPWLGLVVLAGVLTAMLALGALVVVVGLALGAVLVVVAPLADLAVVVLGVTLLLGLNPFVRLPMLAAGGRGGPLRSAYVYGLLYGPITLPCSGALVVSIFSLSLAIDSLAQRLIFFLVFGLGMGLPLLVLSFLAHSRSAGVLRLFTRHERTIARFAGAVLIIVGVVDFFDKLPALQVYLAG